MIFVRSLKENLVLLSAILKFFFFSYMKKPYLQYNCRCEACLCSVLGSLSAACDPASGQCSCRPGYTGHKCNICPDGGGERHGGCEQGHLGFILKISYAKLYAKKMHMSFTLCLSFPRVILHCKKGYKYSRSQPGSH